MNSAALWFRKEYLASEMSTNLSHLSHHLSDGAQAILATPFPLSLPLARIARWRPACEFNRRRKLR